MNLLIIFFWFDLILFIAKWIHRCKPHFLAWWVQREKSHNVKYIYKLELDNAPRLSQRTSSTLPHDDYIFQTSDETWRGNEESKFQKKNIKKGKNRLHVSGIIDIIEKKIYIIGPSCFWIGPSCFFLFRRVFRCLIMYDDVILVMLDNWYSFSRLVKYHDVVLSCLMITE